MASGNTKNFEFRLKKAGLIAVITGMVALLCFAFLLGVNVGKNIDTYPEKISSLPQKALALIWHKGKLQPTENLTDNKNPPEQAKEEDIDLTFFNTLTGKKGVAREKAAPEKKQVIETAPPIVAPLQENNEETVNSNESLETPKQPPEAITDKKKEENKPKIKLKTREHGTALLFPALITKLRRRNPPRKYLKKQVQIVLSAARIAPITKMAMWLIEYVRKFIG